MRAVDRHGREVFSGSVAWPVVFDIVWVCYGRVVVANPRARLGCPPLGHVYQQSLFDGLPARVVGVECLADCLVWA